ncbi:D-alanyl-D-alanine carboxypeptidase family protein [Desulfovibrio inopinatus]|uniref:D-alanyl-D-alanine carboxypeptidase family protein n=1 Tax=Desulfovibrio inopinatus TaxID=102109 RepID=UPI0003FA55A6|nr:D-alanyl-D-alanine carboxypeptidase family protein [Desulfovibrio inopinatus]
MNDSRSWRLYFVDILNHLGKFFLIAFVLVHGVISGEIACSTQLPRYLDISKPPQEAVSAVHRKDVFPLHVKSAILYDMTNSVVLYEQEADKRIAPASLTKLLTLYLVYEAVKDGEVSPEEELRISAKADRTGGSSMDVRTGNTVSLLEVVKGIAIASANDGCVVVAENLGHGDTSEFVKLMNDKAQALGMTQSHFANPNGLPNKRQYTTARDMLVLASAYLSHFPRSLALHSQPVYMRDSVVKKNSNKLIGTCDGVDGLKTGFVASSGFNIVATAERHGRRLVAVVMGAHSAAIRARETRALLEAGFADNGKDSQ